MRVEDATQPLDVAVGRGRQAKLLRLLLHVGDQVHRHRVHRAAEQRAIQRGVIEVVVQARGLRRADRVEARPTQLGLDVGRDELHLRRVRLAHGQRAFVVAGHRLARGLVVIDGVVAVALDVLAQRGQPHPELAGGLEQQGEASAAAVPLVEVLAARRAHRVDVAAGAVVEQRDAQGGDVLLQRHVEHGALGVAHAAALGGAGTERHLAGQLGGVGLVGDVLQQAAHRTGAVQGALRASQHLDVVQVEQAEVERGLRAVDIGAAGAERHVVDVDADRGDRLLTGGYAADADGVVAGAGGGDVDAGLVGQVVAQLARAGVLQLVRGDRLHLHRHLALRLTAARGGDGDDGGIVRAIGVLGGGRASGLRDSHWLYSGFLRAGPRRHRDASQRDQRRQQRDPGSLGGLTGRILDFGHGVPQYVDGSWCFAAIDSLGKAERRDDKC